MTLHAPRLAVLLTPLLLFAGCAGPSTTQRLGYRLQVGLAPDIAAGNAILQPLPNGARVTLVRLPRYAPGRQPVVDDQQRDVRASVVEALLDPSLMRIQLADTSTLPDAQRDARVRNMAQYLEAYELGSTLQPAAPPQAMPPDAPPGLTITINVQCPSRNGPVGDSGGSKPICD
jgi:hypothetical protein